MLQARTNCQSTLKCYQPSNDITDFHKQSNWWWCLWEKKGTKEEEDEKEDDDDDVGEKENIQIHILTHSHTWQIACELMQMENQGQTGHFQISSNTNNLYEVFACYFVPMHVDTFWLSHSEFRIPIKMLHEKLYLDYFMPVAI